MGPYSKPLLFRRLWLINLYISLLIRDNCNSNNSISFRDTDESCDGDDIFMWISTMVLQVEAANV